MSNAGHSHKSEFGVDLNFAMHVLKTLQIMNERGRRTLLGNFCEACEGQTSPHKSVSSRNCTPASGSEALHVCSVTPWPHWPFWSMVGEFPAGVGRAHASGSNKPLNLGPVLFVVAAKGRYRSIVNYKRLGLLKASWQMFAAACVNGSPLCQSAAQWPSWLCHRCLFPASPAARSDASGCACDGVSSRPSFSVHHHSSGSPQVSCRQVELKVVVQRRAHPPSFGPSGPRDGCPPGATINKRFPSHYKEGFKTAFPLLNISLPT